MSNIKYGTIATKTGLTKIANAALLGRELNIVKVKYGDSGGTEYQPTEDQTELVNVVYESSPNNVSSHRDNDTWVSVEAVIPYDIGGFWIREYGLYDEDGDLIFIAAVPPRSKPVGDSHSVDMNFETVIDVKNTDVVKFTADPNKAIASQSYVDDKAQDIVNHRWSSSFKYIKGTVVVASNLERYEAVTDSGTGTPAGVVDPTTDATETHWKKLVNYKETGGLVDGDIETNSFVKSPEIKTNKIIHTDGTETTAVEIPSLNDRLVLARVNFNGTGVVAIREAINVSTVTDNSTGDYTINFLEELPDGNYTVVCTAGDYWGSTSVVTIKGTPSTTSLNIVIRDGNDVLNDRAYVNVVIYGG